MDSREALHTCARRYCIDRREHWKSRQAQENSEGLASRQQTLQLILCDVERFRPEDFASLAHARRTLILAASTLEIDIDPAVENVEAIAEERDLDWCNLSLLDREDL